MDVQRLKSGIDDSIQKFKPCIELFSACSIDEGIEIIKYLKILASNRKLVIPTNSETEPKMKIIRSCLEMFQSIPDDAICASIIETLEQINASKFPIYKVLIKHFSPKQFKFQITAVKGQLTMLISSINGGSKCVTLILKNSKWLHVDSLDKCDADKGPQLLEAILSFAEAIPVEQITLIDAAYVDICGEGVPLAPLKIVTTGMSWYNRFNYFSDNFSDEREYNQGVINRLFTDLIAERQDIFPLHIINKMNEMLPIHNTTFKEYITAFEQSIGRDKDCNKLKAELLGSIMKNIDRNIEDMNMKKDSSTRPFLIYNYDLHQNITKHGGKRRRLQTMRNSYKGAKTSKRNINKSKRNLHNSKINKSKRNITKCK